MGDTDRNKNLNRSRRPLTGCSMNSIDSSYYQAAQPLDSISCSPKIISSPESVFIVIRDFDERKKELVRSIGFSGLLNLSRFSELDANFSLWLLRKVHFNNGSIRPCAKISFVMRPEHIGRIIGIPYSGIEVKDKAFESDDQKFVFMKQSLSFLGNESQILYSAGEYIQQDLPFGFSKEQANKFKVAFVIFVMGQFLAPSSSATIARSDFWGALKNPDAIHSFNWSSFVLADIIDASRSVVWDVLRNFTVKVILGCPLILQILYLDIMDIGNLKLPHDIIPRIKHFNSALLRRMIQADIVEEESTPDKPVYGRAKAIRVDNTCYNFEHNGSSEIRPEHSTDINDVICAQVQHNSPEEYRTFQSTGKTPITENNCSDFRTPLGNNILYDSDVPDFSATIRDYFQGQVDASLLECFRFHQAMCLQHFVKYSNGLKAAITKENIKLVAKVVNHQRHCTGLPPINLELTRPSVVRRNYDDMLSGAESGDEITPAQSRKKNAARLHDFQPQLGQKGRQLQRSSTTLKDVNGSSSSMFSPPHTAQHLSPSLSEPIIDKQIYKTPDNYTRKPPVTVPIPFGPPGANLGIRILSPAKVEHLNGSSIDDEYSEAPVTKKHVQPGRLAVTHWSRSIDHPTREPSLTRSFFDWLSSTTSSVLQNAWIRHDSPRYIQITGKQLKDHFSSIQPMTYDAFDICVRRITQLDKAICPKDVHLRWRHLLESDFAMYVLGGENPASNVSIMRQFDSSMLDYQLERCRTFFVPVFVDGLWWCYAWDLKASTLTICDPSVSQQTDSLVIQKHVGTIQVLSKFLSETVFHFYTGWDPKFLSCNILVFRTPDMPIERSDSAFFTLFFIKNFNGTNLVTTSSLSALQIFKHYMLYEILELKENRGTPPSSYIHSIND